MLKNSVIIPLEPNPYKGTKTQVSLKEKDYTIPIYGMPNNAEVIVIKADAFSDIALTAVFNNSKHECKRADFVIIANTGKQKVIIFIECKAKTTTSTLKEIVQQLKGAKCFVAYCKEVGKIFWDNKNFLNDYEYRYVTLRNISISKKSTREKNTPIHDCPENMLKIASPHHLEFNHLVGKK